MIIPLTKESKMLDALDAATISLAIELSDPSMNTRTNHYYANAIYHQSIKKNIDPLLQIAIIKHESHWNARLISADGLDYGLMQIREKYVNVSPSNLLEGGTNIRVGSYLMVASQEFCNKRLKRESSNQEWLACYQGSCGSVRKMCKSTNLSFKVDSYRQCLYDSLLDQTDYPCGEIYKNYKYNGKYPVKNKQQN